MIDDHDSDAAGEAGSRRKKRHDQATYDVGYGRPPRQHQFRKGQPSSNPKGRPRGSGRIGLYKILMEPVSIRKNGRTRRTPFPAAHLQRIMERAAKGDPKADQVLLQLYKTMHLFDSEASDEPITFTLNLCRPGMSPLGEDGAPIDDDVDPSESPSRRKDNDQQP